MSTVQYTIRNIPTVVDQVIRKRAKQTGKSFNQTVVDMLSLQSVGTTKPEENNNFDWLFGSMKLDDKFDEAIKDLSQIDKELWQ
jgi:hypothetical protein